MSRAGTRPSQGLSLSLLLHLLVLAACSPQASPRADSVAASEFNGTWVSDGGEFRIWALDQQRLQVEFQGEHEYQTPLGPMVNVGMGEGVAVVEDGTASFRPEGADPECAITLRLDGEHLEADESGDCGFGLNVTAAGTYRRVSHEQPEFGLP